ncbi:MAG: hypothetical protein HN750_00495, partial [Gemmatimonadales bacterium]|nr:hypothetical protein [Gemmatimonadales bacterium]
MAERTQMLRYAKDLARLYRSAKDDRQRLDKIQWRLRTLERACLDLVRCLSPEAVSKRVARAGVNLLGLTTAGVYLSRGEQYLLVARDDNTVHFPPSAQVSRSELEALCGEPDEFLCSPWTELVGGGPAVVIPLLGRRRAVGFLIGEGDLEDLEDGATRETISLLSGSAGVVLENFLLEEKRGRGSVLAGAPLDRD